MNSSNCILVTDCSSLPETVSGDAKVESCLQSIFRQNGNRCFLGKVVLLAYGGLSGVLRLGSQAPAGRCLHHHTGFWSCLARQLHVQQACCMQVNHLQRESDAACSMSHITQSLVQCLPSAHTSTRGGSFHLSCGLALPLCSSHLAYLQTVSLHPQSHACHVTSIELLRRVTINHYGITLHKISSCTRQTPMQYFSLTFSFRGGKGDVYLWGYILFATCSHSSGCGLWLSIPDSACSPLMSGQVRKVY